MQLGRSRAGSRVGNGGSIQQAYLIPGIKLSGALSLGLGGSARMQLGRSRAGSRVGNEGVGGRAVSPVGRAVADPPDSCLQGCSWRVIQACLQRWHHRSPAQATLAYLSAIYIGMWYLCFLRYFTSSSAGPGPL